MVSSYERVSIKGRSYLVCADCRRPLLKGSMPLYWVPQAGYPTKPTGRKIKQAVCGPCYIKQWTIVQPDSIPPNVDDGYLEGEGPVPRGVREIKEELKCCQTCGRVTYFLFFDYC